MKEAGRRESAIDALGDLMERRATRLVLSALILASLLPLPIVHELRLVFFGVFSAEILLRCLLLFRRSPDGRRRRPGFVEWLFLLFDIVATLSFLDWSHLGDARFLRLFRLTRLLLLAGYWRGFLRDLWTISRQPERRDQLGFVAAVVVTATLTAAVLLQVIVEEPHDFDGDGHLYAWEQDGASAPPSDGTLERDPEDMEFLTQLWWAFRQVEDPGNLVEDPRNLPLLAVSLTLTIGGLLVFSFLVGIGTTVVEELVVLSRQRRLGLRRHVVVIGGGGHAHFLLEELAAFQAKRVLRAKIVLFGLESERPAVLASPSMRRVHYRHGDPARPEQLLRADVDRASLVIVLGDDEGGDALTVSRILAVRQVNPSCRIVADVQRAQNERSVREAGGEGTAAVTTRRFVGLFLAAELLFPGLDALLRELLTSLGQELYLADVGRPVRVERFDRLVASSVAERGVVPLGLDLRGREGRPRIRLNPGPDESFEEVSGLLVLARSSEAAARYGAWVAGGLLASGRDGTRALERHDGTRAYEARASEGLDLALSPEGLDLVLSPELERLHRLLICGYREEVGDLLAELGQFLRELEVHLMVAPGRVDEVAGDLAGRMPHASGARWAMREDGLVVLERAGRVCLTVRVFVGDPASDRSIGADASVGHELSSTDAVLFVADGSWGSDPDAKSALGLLKLLGLARDRAVTLRPGFRVVGEIQEAGKGDLLEHRLRELRRAQSGGRSDGERPEASTQPGTCGGSDRSAILSTEKLRHYLLGQEVLVPGIAGLYEELLTETGDELLKLVPREGGGLPPGPDLSFPALTAELAGRRLVLLGVELAGEDGPRTFVNPGEGEPGHRFAPERLTGLFCLGQVERLRGQRGDGPR